MSDAGGGAAGPQHPFDLWHPSARPRRRAVIGGTRTDFALPDDARSRGDEAPADLVVVAPGQDAVDRRWVDRAVAAAVARMAPDAVLWISVPRAARHAAERALRRYGLILREAVLLVPAGAAPTHLVSIRAASLADAARRHFGVPNALAVVLRLLGANPAGRALLRHGAPACGLLATSSRDVELLSWMHDLDGTPVAASAVATGPRRDARVVVAMRYPADAHEPDLAVKVALDDAGCRRLERERKALVTLGPAARLAAASVPTPRPFSAPWLLVNNALSGVPASTVLWRRPDRMPAIVTQLAGWLLTWTSANAIRVSGPPERMRRLVLEPIRRVAQTSGVGGELAPYLSAVERLAVGIEHQELVVAPAHNDLTMSNVLLDGERLGVIDWEAAAAEDLPLCDLWYALVDAIARADRSSHRAAVLRLVSAGPGVSMLAALPERHAAALSCSAQQSLLAFHCCWLRHAADELIRGEDAGPFLSVVRSVAAERLLWPGG